MPEISAVILTLNEEQNIGRCIDSVKDVVDDIVVVDSFSTDKTEEICKSKGIRFVQHKFEGHIEQKNYAITQAIYPYVLSLDADEALSDKLRQSILDIKNNWQYDGYSMNRLNNYCGKWIKHTGWYPDRKLRLWDSRKGKWTGENPHDRYEMEKEAKISFLKGNLLHYSYHSISQHIEQIQKFSTISAKTKFKKGKNMNILMLIIRPLVFFIKKYFLKMGILDGYYGFIISVLTSYYIFVKDIKLRELNKNKPDNL